jgi:hypothetical protein
MSGIHQLLFGSGGDVEIVNTGNWTTGYDTNFGFSLGQGGSIIDGRFSPCGNAVITALYVGGLGAFSIFFSVVGNFDNLGFEQMQITASTGLQTILFRSNATFASGAGSTTWSWSGAGNNEFGFAGSTATVVFS